MDYQFIVGKLSDVIWHSAILVSIVGLLKIFLTQYFLYKITVAKKSEIKLGEFHWREPPNFTFGSHFRNRKSFLVI